MKSQNAEILAYLKTGKPLTSKAIITKFKCIRPGARIKDLRNSGHMILTTMISRRNKHSGRNTRYAEYSLEES